MNIFTFTQQTAARVWAVFAVVSMVLTMVPSVAFAAEAATLNQAENGGVNNAPISPVDWVTGNVNQAKGHYVEGQSVAYKMEVTGLTPGVQSSLIVGFDVTKSNKYALDYITSDDRIAETVDPCSDTSICSGPADDTEVIPAPAYSGVNGATNAADVTASFNQLVSDEGAQVMKIWNGTIDSLAYTTQADISVADEEARFTVLFTPDAGQTSVVLSWGGHIASSLDYPGQSAVTINGSPYHMRLISLNGKGGNQDRSLSASAVTPQGNVTITKVVVNDNGGTLQASDFPLFVDSTQVTSGVANSFDVGTYTVSETEHQDYTAGAWGGDCDPDGTLVVEADQTYNCTITNDDNAPSLTLSKTVVGGPASASDFELIATGPTTLSGNGGAVSNATFDAGTYTLSEVDNSNLSEGSYSAGAWNCTGATVANGNEITIGLGDTVSCEITNTYVPPAKGSITIVKTVLNNFGGTATTDSFNYFITSATNAVTNMVNGVAQLFDPGNYTASESSLSGYSAGAWGGDGCTDGTISLADQDDVTCTITNSDIAPELTIVKVVDNGTSKNPRDPEYFDLVLTATDINGTADTEVTFQDDGTGTTYTLDAGAYAVTEPSHNGYTVTFSDECTSVVAGDIAIGETRTCTVTNTYIEPTTAVINFFKEVVNDNGGTASSTDFTFDVAGTASFNGIVHSGQIVVGLGDYTVTENGPSGYELTGYSDDCSNGTISIGQNQLGETLNCTITNDDIQPKLTVIKVVDNDNTYQAGDAIPSDFVIEVTGNGISTTSFDGSTNGEVLNLNAGNYNVTEPDSGNYSVTYSGACDANGDVTLSVGDDKTCIVTNNDLDPTTAVVNFFKVVNNNFGGTATPDNFSFEVFDGNATTAVAHGGSLVLGLGSYDVTENSVKGYRFVSNNDFCAGGDFAITGAELGQSFDCYFTNEDIEPQLTVTKIVKGGKATTSDFTLLVDTTTVLSGETNGFNAGTYAITETFDPSVGTYTAVYSGACDVDGNVTLEVGDDVECVITNSAYTVTGFKWKDRADLLNNLAPNGIFDTGSDGEERLKGWEIIASSTNEILSTVTGDSGFYSLALTPGTWEISEILQGGWLQTGVIQDGSPVQGSSCTVIFDEQSQSFETTCDFGNYKIRKPVVSCDMFEANPSSVRRGDDVTLTWETTDADEVEIDNGVGSVSRDGSVVVNPTNDTVYTLTARHYYSIEDELSDSEFVEEEYEEVTCQVLVDIRGGGGGGGTRVNRNPDPDPQPLVLGEQVDAVPVGAPDTGRGGMSVTIIGELLATPRRRQEV